MEMYGNKTTISEEIPIEPYIPLYPNNLKSRELGEEAPQNFCPERATIAERQGASENENFEVKPTLPKPDFSSCLGITSDC